MLPHLEKHWVPGRRAIGCGNHFPCLFRPLSILMGHPKNRALCHMQHCAYVCLRPETQPQQTTGVCAVLLRPCALVQNMHIDKYSQRWAHLVSGQPNADIMVALPAASKPSRQKLPWPYLHYCRRVLRLSLPGRLLLRNVNCHCHILHTICVDTKAPCQVMPHLNDAASGDHHAQV